MTTNIQTHHTQKPAYIYIRQSTMGQVRLHKESTERQYALKNRAIELGWSPELVRVLDGDLGVSGAHTCGREDFKRLVADVTMGEVGAVVSLEASRLARSSADWHRLIEVCSLTETLIIDEDACYDPADFNDGLLLGLKGTMSQAELHFIRSRLLGGKRNKAKKGELRFVLPVGLNHDDRGRIILDPDQQVQGAVRLIFQSFRETGSAYGVAHHFRKHDLLFPKRTYGGAWDGKLFWGPLSHARVLGVLKNPSYAGTYVYGRYTAAKAIHADGEIRSSTKKKPMAEWSVMIHGHHEGFITWDEFLQNQVRLERNQTNGEDTRLSGPVREGLALLQGLLLCGHCGHRITVRYQGNGGLYPVYDCSWLRREGMATAPCFAIRCDRLDQAMAKRALEVMQPAQLELALKAIEELERRDHGVVQQWQMRIQQSEYEANLAERRYEQVDPANRLVAASLERRWNEALQLLEQTKKQFEEYRRSHARALTVERKTTLLGLAQDFPRLWHAPTTSAKDKKRMLRLLIEDISVTKLEQQMVSLQVRWRGGATEEILVERPKPSADQVRTTRDLIDRIAELAQTMTDDQIVEQLNAEGRKPPKGGSFTNSSVRWIRHKYGIAGPTFNRPEELSVLELMALLKVSRNVVYYWIETGVVEARRRNGGSPYFIALSDTKKAELEDWVRNSTRISKGRDS